MVRSQNSSFKNSLFIGCVFLERLTRTIPGKTKSKLKSKFKHPYTVSLKYDSEHHTTPHRKQCFLWGKFVLALKQNLSETFNTRSSFNKKSSVLSHLKQIADVPMPSCSCSQVMHFQLVRCQQMDSQAELDTIILFCSLKIMIWEFFPYRVFIRCHQS